MLLLSATAACGGPPEPSLSFGRRGCGRVTGAVAAPCEGDNFAAFTPLSCWLGRNYLHPRVMATVLDAYALLQTRMPQRRWVVGELGRSHGGRLWPHRSHQNGLAADFFMPVVDAAGAPAMLPIGFTNKWGYGLEFTPQGELPPLRVDWQAVGAHLLALQEAGRAHGVSIDRVIVTPDFHAALLQATPALLGLTQRFMRGEAWVRHDEHYHVDFNIPADERRPLSCK